MSSDITSVKSSRLTIVGDACLFTAAAFCLLVVMGGPFAVLIGPATAWLLHGRRIDRTAVIGGGVGVAVGLAVVGGFFALAPRVAGAIGPVGGWGFNMPVAFLATAGAAFLVLLVALNIDGLRDLSPARRKHTRLDFARLASTLVIAVFAVVVSISWWVFPESEIGDAGVFALGAAAVGALTMLVADTIVARSVKRSRASGTIQMSDLTGVLGDVPNKPRSSGTAALPATAFGWWTLGFSVVAVASWIVLPVVTTIYRDTYLVTDTWVMPAIGTVLVDIAAVLCVLCVWRAQERSVLNIVAAVVMVPMALFFTFMVVGEGLGGA